MTDDRLGSEFPSRSRLLGSRELLRPSKSKGSERRL